MNIHHVLCDPYLVSFPFYTIPICLFLKIHRIFYLPVKYLQLCVNRYGVPEASAHHGNAKMHLCTILFASFRSEEVVIRKIA